MVADKISDNDAEKAFCEKVGALILWVSAIDVQLTKAVIQLYTLAESPMLEPIVAELGVRAKIQLIQVRAKHITPANWSKPIKKWTKNVDEVSTYRNIVAHHSVALSDGELTLFSAQATRLLRNIKDLNAPPPITINEIEQWLEKAKGTHAEGRNILENLNRFVEEAARRRVGERARRSARPPE